MINKPRGISNFGRNFSAKIETPLKSESPKLKIEKNTQKLISKCENLKDQNFELLQ